MLIGPRSPKAGSTVHGNRGAQKELKILKYRSALVSGGQNVIQVWNGTPTTSGSTVTVRNAPYNGSVPASGSTTFGFLANGTPSTPALTCVSP